MLLPDRLRILWGEVDAGRLRKEGALLEQEQQLDAYGETWKNALLCEGECDLRTSLLREVASYYGIADLAEVDRLCSGAVEAMQHEWERHIDPSKRASIESFYQSATMVYDLMGWH